MNSKTWTRIIALALFAALSIPVQLAAQDKQDHHHKYHHYQLIELGTFGGPNSGVNFEPFQNVINNAGTVVGGADTSILTPEPGCYNPFGNPDCFISHAFVSRSNNLKDLGTLPGGNFSFATAINQRGQIAGLSENDQIDPFSGNPEFHAVLWENDKILDLGTLGGVSSIAATLNDSGQVTGVALNDVPDPFSLLGLGSVTTLTQTHGFLWQNGKIHDLGTLGGPDSWAVFVNDRGQVAGTSYTSDVIDPNTGTPPVGVFLWENGKMRDLGNLGGDNGLLTAYGIVNGLNNHGQVAGAMVAAGDQFVHAFLWNGQKLFDLGTLGGNFSFARGINDAGEVTGPAWLPGDQVNHGFLWRNGVMTDLGTLGGDPCSDALSINSPGQVVGASQSAAGGCNEWTTAFLWENGGPSVDLNTLVPSGSGVHLFAGFWTNDGGEIVAGGNPPVCDINATCAHAYVLIPCDENHPNVEGCDYSLVDAAATAAPSNSAPMTFGLAAATSTQHLTPSEIVAAWRTPMLRRLHIAGAATAQTALVSVPSAILSPTSLSFSTQAIGTTSAAKIVTLKNTGTTSVTITAIAIAGTNAGDFAQTHTCGSSLAAGASCSISLTFKPTGSGTRTAALSVTDNATGSPQKVALLGMGVIGGKLTGYCVHGSVIPFLGCSITSDTAECSPGKPAMNPVTISCGLGSFKVDKGTSCRVVINGRSFGGYCQSTP
jgi:probable HAF family extracellular repeat protein